MKSLNSLDFYVSASLIRTGKGSGKREFSSGGGSEALEPQGFKTQRANEPVVRFREAAQMLEKVNFENLDALRFFAFLLVFIAHASLFLGYTHQNFSNFRYMYLNHGDLGVSFFFVLSGFLITHLLLREKTKGDISIKHFYIRRILRIWPLYFFILIFGFFVIPNTPSGNFPFGTTINISLLPWYLFFLANIPLAFNTVTSTILAILWSISIEEQFYLLWPLIVRFFNRKKFVIVLSVVILASCMYRYHTFTSYDRVHYFTLSVFSDLAIGSLAGIVSFNKNNFLERITLLPKKYIISVYVILCTLIPLHMKWHGSLFISLMPIIFALLFGFIILEQTYSINSFWKVGKLKIADSLGKISYGLYVYHLIAFFVVLVVLNWLGIPYQNTNIVFTILKAILALLLTIVFAKISYRCLESPFLKLKNKYGYAK